MTSSTILTITCVAVTVCVALFMILSISLPQWYVANLESYGESFKGKGGLFRACYKDEEVSGCDTFKGEFLPGV